MVNIWWLRNAPAAIGLPARGSHRGSARSIFTKFLLDFAKNCTLKYCIHSPFMCSILYCKAAHYFAIHKRKSDKFNSHIFFHIWQKSTTALHCKHCTALHHSEILLRSPFIFSLPKSSVSQTNHFVYDFSVPAAQNHLGNEL